MPFDPAKVRAVLFDLDGTLADTDDEYIRRATQLLRPVHWLFPKGDPTAFLRWGAMTAESPLNTLMGLPDVFGLDDELVRLANWFADWRGQQTKGHFVLMAGAANLLAQLATRYPLAIVTARSERATQAFITQFGLERTFGAVAFAQAAAHTKPYPDPVIWAANRLGVPAANCLMVGDTPVDIWSGRRAGAQTIGLLCGFGERAELERAGADLILEQTASLADVLL